MAAVVAPPEMDMNTPLTGENGRECQMRPGYLGRYQNGQELTLVLAAAGREVGSTTYRGQPPAVVFLCSGPQY